MLVGLIGIVVPVLPGLFLVWAASAVWAVVEQGLTAWVVLTVTTILYAAGLVTQYTVPGRRLREAGVATKVLVVAILAGAVGFFVIPVVGAPLLFVGAIYLMSRVRMGSHADAWLATTHAVRAVGLSMGIELLTAFAIITTWVVGSMLLR
ncbi:MAG: DUF456 domain-containing protein [Intrasporangium sp.]|uniref:DUF456 domain-containing protein n=1 Tax=Intrasporangium sp. TaxID=1925024 RepID=UPI0026498E70|nr:DUF456 domain-containing protein [Intrasporangium sp.]MDN5795126.1 DUF456 domain-containing protein [Intrasporangium sp.]